MSIQEQDISNSMIAGDEGMVLVSKLDKIINWNRKSSIWFLLFGLACCGIELMQFWAEAISTASELFHERHHGRQTS